MLVADVSFCFTVVNWACEVCDFFNCNNTFSTGMKSYGIIIYIYILQKMMRI